jgi:tagatose 6-phosphate kinase
VILVAGLTPAWQQIMRFDAFRPGEVNRASEVYWCASGKVLNVGIALARLGARSLTLAPLGGSAAGAIEREFAALKVDRHWIDVAAPTRVCTTILDAGAGRTTELVENAGALTDADLLRFADAFLAKSAAASLVILTGSLPSGTRSSWYRELAENATCPIIADVRGAELVALLPLRPLVVKPNREELAWTVGRELASDADLHAAMREIHDAGAHWVVVTDGARAVWVLGNGRLYRYEPPQVEVVNPIGAGDCLAAGLAWGLQLGLDMPSAVTLGLAAAGENVANLLPARLDPVLVERRCAEVRLVSVETAGNRIV